MEKRKYVIVRAADHARAIVILNKQDYEEEMVRLLATKDTYKKNLNYCKRDKGWGFSPKMKPNI